MNGRQRRQFCSMGRDRQHLKSLITDRPLKVTFPGDVRFGTGINRGTVSELQKCDRARLSLGLGGRLDLPN